MGDYDLDTNMNTMNVQFCNGKDHQDFQDFDYSTKLQGSRYSILFI